MYNEVRVCRQNVNGTYTTRRALRIRNKAKENNRDAKYLLLLVAATTSASLLVIRHRIPVGFLDLGSFCVVHFDEVLLRRNRFD